MKKLILIGSEKTKRTDYFLKAADELGIPVLFQSVQNCIPEELEPAIVKLDPFAYSQIKGNSIEVNTLEMNTAEVNTIEVNAIEKMTENYTVFLNRFLSNKNLKFLNYPTDILEVLHKVKCKEKMMQNGIATTKMIGAGIKSREELQEIMEKKRVYAVFIKPVCGSGAAGVMAYRFVPRTKKEVLYTSSYLEKGKLINTKTLYRIEQPDKIKLLLDKIFSMETMAECWYPKAEFRGKVYDLRVVWQFGRADFMVARQSKGPITNLHLNNQALKADELCLSEKKKEEIFSLCESAMKLFSGLSYAGIDIMLEKNSMKPLIIEINGQGDLLYQDIFQENSIYKNQILHMYKMAQM